MIRRQKLIGIVASVVLAAVGTGLLVAYVRGAEDGPSRARRPSSVLVVSDTIPKGTKAEDIGGKVRSSGPGQGRGRGRPGHLGPLAGQVTASTSLPGEQLVRAGSPRPAEAQGVAAGHAPGDRRPRPVRAVGGQVRKGDTVGVWSRSRTPRPPT